MEDFSHSSMIPNFPISPNRSDQGQHDNITEEYGDNYEEDSKNLLLESPFSSYNFFKKSGNPNHQKQEDYIDENESDKRSMVEEEEEEASFTLIDDNICDLESVPKILYVEEVFTGIELNQVDQNNEEKIASRETIYPSNVQNQPSQNKASLTDQKELNTSNPRDQQSTTSQSNEGPPSGNLKLTKSLNQETLNPIQDQLGMPNNQIISQSSQDEQKIDDNKVSQFLFDQIMNFEEIHDILETREEPKILQKKISKPEKNSSPKPASAKNKTKSNKDPTKMKELPSYCIVAIKSSYSHFRIFEEERQNYEAGDFAGIKKKYKLEGISRVIEDNQVSQDTLKRFDKFIKSLRGVEIKTHEAVEREVEKFSDLELKDFGDQLVEDLCWRFADAILSDDNQIKTWFHNSNIGEDRKNNDYWPRMSQFRTRFLQNFRHY